jgi:hydrogenase maturation protease
LNVDPVRAIADAVLYEGYILWPYTRTATKNQRRFTFGGVYPPGHSESHPDDPSCMQTEVLLTGDARATVEITVRFLQVMQRAVARTRGDELEQVDELTVGGERYLAWEEAVEREVLLPALGVDGLREGRGVAIAIPAGVQGEEIRDGEGELAGMLIRSWQALRGELWVSAAPAGGGAWRIRARIINLTDFTEGSREDAVRRAFCSTHTLLRSQEGAFASLADPPGDLAAAAASCQNVGTWPVPVGESGDQSTILSSPIILEDYPRIAPESPGDLFDGGEIDQLLVLNILALTDDEKAEMAATDPRARQILERTEALTPEQLMALHGTVRETGMVR